MPISEMPPLAAWESFYVIVGSSAAALTGLQFVVVALSDEAKTRSAAAVEAFATPTIVHFCVVLLLAALAATPGQTATSLSWCFSIVGLGGVVYAASVAIRLKRVKQYSPVLEDWLWHVCFPLSGYGCLLVVGLLFRTHPAGALYWIAATALLLLYVGIHNAWDAAVYIMLTGKSL
jgi:hypothetical protein